MPPRPFPFDIGIGTDIVHVSRIRRLLSGGVPKCDAKEEMLGRFMRRFLTYREQELFWDRFKDQNTALGTALDDTARYLAGRWAAKEAAIKAVKSRQLNFMEIQILKHKPINGRSGVFALILDEPESPSRTEQTKSEQSNDRQYRSNLDDPPGQVAKISISHDGEYATAVCLAVGNPAAGGAGGETTARST